MTLKYKRNAVFEAVESAGGIDVQECKIDYDDTSARITHMPSGANFLIEGDPGPYKTTAVVGDLPPWKVDAHIWPTVEERLQRWAREVKLDADTPDLWAELGSERELLTGAAYEGVANSPFTPHEQAEIAKQFREIKELIREKYSLSEAQMLSLDA